jgi:hypothetical protein
VEQHNGDDGDGAQAVDIGAITRFLTRGRHVAVPKVTRRSSNPMPPAKNRHRHVSEHREVAPSPQDRGGDSLGWLVITSAARLVFVISHAQPMHSVPGK